MELQRTHRPNSLVASNDSHINAPNHPDLCTAHCSSSCHETSIHGLESCYAWLDRIGHRCHLRARHALHQMEGISRYRQRDSYMAKEPLGVDTRSSHAWSGLRYQVPNRPLAYFQQHSQDCVWVG